MTRSSLQKVLRNPLKSIVISKLSSNCKVQEQYTKINCISVQYKSEIKKTSLFTIATKDQTETILTKAVEELLEKVEIVFN